MKTAFIKERQSSTVADFITLLKPGVMILVVFSGITGMVMALCKSHYPIHPVAFFVSILSIIIASGGAASINMWYDSDIDAIMTRTKTRPIPSGRIPRETALEFGVTLGFLSVFLMYIATNILSAFLLLISILFYVFIYTIWLKRRTPYNIVIGGAAGSFPPMIGWAVVTNSITIESVILFLIIFLWTPPHFWALSIKKNNDYIDAKIPMLPVTDGIMATKRQIIIYTILLFLVTLAPCLIGMSGVIYFVVALIFGLLFLAKAIRLYYDKDNKTSMKLFGYSIYYMFILLSAFMIDAIIA